MTGAQTNAAFRGETDGYDIGRNRLLGRHAAGNGILRAAVAAAGGRPIVGYGGLKAAKPFTDLVHSMDPAAKVHWAAVDNPTALAQAGVLYLADPIMGPPARLRLRAGPAAYSLCGVTHTTASGAAMDQIAGLLSEPLAAWDALVCTSSAVLETVRVVHEAESEYLRWRLGSEVRLSGPMLPVIPLGVHTADFDFTESQRKAARTELGVEPDEVVVLYLARYSPYGKAHPLVMFRGLEAAARRSGKRFVLNLCGWPAVAGVDELYRKAADDFAPSVRTVFTDGRMADERSRSWASADLFVSLVDGIQETFGLTPIEAKAAGLPVICTDWNGYRDTVREGVDGFRIPTWAPGPGHGEAIGTAFEAGTMTYDHYAWAVASTTAVELEPLADRLAELATNPDLRRRMGEAGRADARARFEWAKIYRDYQALWTELTARRRAALETPDEAAWLRAAPTANPRRQDPFRPFGHYPTHTLADETQVVVAAHATRATVVELSAHRLFALAVAPPEALLAIWDALAAAPATVALLAERTGLAPSAVARAVGLLAKMDVVRLG